MLCIGNMIDFFIIGITIIFAIGDKGDINDINISSASSLQNNKRYNDDVNIKHKMFCLHNSRCFAFLYD